MSAISLKSITGITSITTPAGVDNQLTLHTNDTSEKLRITSEGKLGVNWNSPVTIIHAIGNNTVGTSVTMTLQSHDTINATAGINLLARRRDNVNETCKIQAASDGQNSVDLQFHTNSNERLRITSAGLVGIGLTLPAVRLHVQGTGNEIAHFTGANGGQLKFRNATNNIFLAYTNTSDIFQLGTNGQNPRVHVAVNGNVGVNETNPFHKLHVGGDIGIGFNTPNDAGRQLNFNVNRGSAGDTLANINWQWNNKYVAQIRGVAGSDTTNKDDAHLLFFTSAANNLVERLRIRSDGRVGINTDNPQTTLYSMDEIAAGDGNRRFIGMETKVVNGTAVGEIRTTYYSGANGNYPEMRFVTHDTERLRINSNGTVHTLMTGTAPGWLGSTIATREKFSIFQGANFGEACFNIDVDNANTFLSHNMYYNGGWKIRKSGSPVRHLEIGTNGWTFMTGADGSDDTGSALTKRVRIDSGGKLSIGDAATHTFSAHSEGDDLVIGGAGWRGMTIYGEGGGGVIQFADDADNRVGQILYYHAENSMSFRVNGNQTRLKIDSNGDVCIGNSGNPPWTETGGNYNNISLCGNDANSSGFLNLGNGAATNNADFDLARIKFFNGGTEVATIKATTATSDNGDADIKFFTKKAGSGAKEILRIRNDGFVETMYSENTGSYSLSTSPTPRLRIRNDYGGDGIISAAQFYAKRGSGAASIFNIGVITTSTDYESNLIIQSRNTDASYSEKLRIESEGQLRMNYGNNAKQAYALRSTFRTITGHSTTGYQYVRFALLAARTPYRVYIGTTGGNYGPGAQFFTVLRNWDSTTLYVSDKFNMGSAYANAVRMQSDNAGGDYYLEISINLTTTSQGFNAAIIPIGANAGTMRTALQFYGSGMSNLTATSSAHSL